MFRKNLQGIGLMAFAMALGLSQPAQAEMSKQEVEDIVRQFIMDNPQVVLDSINLMQQKQRQQEMSKAAETIKEKQDALFKSENDPIAGNPEGDHVIVQFFDYNCGYCKRVTPTLETLLKEDDELKVIFKEFPILSPSSEEAAKVALAVNKVAPEKYWDFHQALMKLSGQKNTSTMINIATGMGIDEDDLREAISDPEIARHIQEDRELGQSIGVRGTPAFVIGDELIPGAVDIDTLRSKLK